MKRFLLFITAMVLGLLHPLTTSAARSAANPQKAEAQAPSFYAVTAAPTVGISKFTVHHRAPPLSKTGNNISISTLQILLKVVTFAQASK